MRLAKLTLFLSFLHAGIVAAQPAPAPAVQAAPAAPAAPTIYSVAAGKSSLTFHVVHKLHRVDGESKAVEGKVRLLPDGKAQVMLRARSDSFDSKNVNRDAKVKEVVEAARFPNIEFKASGEGVQPPAGAGTVEKTFKAQVTFHGVQKMIDLPVKLTFEADGSVRAQATIALSLDEFKIERPSLMFVKVDDELKIDANVVFVKG
jgi:polyisoprenoid-binding protein YceI